jgi:hypothetical protein
MSETPETDAKQKLRDRILAERKAGNVVFWGLPGKLIGAKLDDFVRQNAEGLLYDLNRLEEISMTFIDDPKWVNDFAVALTIRKIMEQRNAAERQRDAEIDEFNKGFSLYGKVRFEDLPDGDQIAIGYAWAAFGDLRKQRDEAVRILQNVDLMIDELLSQDGYVSQKTMVEVGEDIGSFLATLDRTEKP